MTEWSGFAQVLRDMGGSDEVDKKRAEELVGVFNAIQDAIFVLDRQGRVARINSAADWLFRGHGISLNATLDSILSIQHLNGDPVRLEDRPWSRALRGGTIIRERYQLIGTGQGRAYVVISANPLIAGATFHGAVVVCRDISERYQLFLQISVEQARLRALVENAPHLMVVVDRDSRILIQNSLARESVDWAFLSHSDSAGGGQVVVWDASGKPLAKADFPLVRSALEGLTIHGDEVVLQTLQGEERTFQSFTNPIRDPENRIIGATGIFMDITEKKLEVIKEEEQRRRRELLASLAQDFAEAGLDNHAVLDAVAIRTAEIFRDGCFLWLKPEDREGLEPAACFHTNRQTAALYKDRLNGLFQPAAEALFRRVMLRGETALLTELASNSLLDLFSPSLGELLMSTQAHSAMVAPLKPRGRILGLICLIRDATGLPYSQDDLAYFVEIVTLASLAIDNAHLFRSLSREARERDALYAANEALLSTLDLETLFGKILDAAQSAVPAAEKGMLYISLPRTGELKLRSQVGFADPRIARMFLTGRKDFVAKAAREGQPLLVRDTWDHPSLLARVNLGEKRAPRSLIVAPMILDQKVRGVLMLSASAPDAFLESDLDVLNRFATTATVAFQNASLHTDIQRMAITDGLTGLYNRRGFLEIGRREFDRFHRNSIPLAAILLDIDHFKAINDLHSHAVGDMVLRMVADRCRAAVRKVDIVGRFGGDEFSILLPGVELRVAREVADRLCRLVSAHPFPTNKKPLPVTVSLGVVAARKKMKSLETMLDKADAALYLAKQRGRNTAAVGED